VQEIKVAAIIRRAKTKDRILFIINLTKILF